jgi:hypothetical protein
MIRRMYPTCSTHNNGLMSKNISYPMPEPTDIPPGTLEKVLVMCDRAERGLCVTHPLDRR